MAGVVERGNHRVEIGFGAANARMMRVHHRDSHCRSGRFIRTCHRRRKRRSLRSVPAPSVPGKLASANASPIVGVSPCKTR